MGVADHFGASMMLTLGALLADVPHSRPVQIIGTATDDDLIDRFELAALALRRPNRNRWRVARQLLHSSNAIGGIVGCSARVCIASAFAKSIAVTHAPRMRNHWHASTSCFGHEPD